MTNTTDKSRFRWRQDRYHGRFLILMAIYLTVSCALSPVWKHVSRHRWNTNRGPVVPHDTFPADCTLCHEQGGWNKMRADFHFDHALETGVPLFGAHHQAECLRCHNDRGPVAVFARRGCSGCHDDVHRGQLGSLCSQCHNENDWVPEGQIVLHNRTRFPLVGAHTAVACFRCHPGAPVGNLVRAPVECEACHQQALSQAKNPDHIAQGWIQGCDRCHQPIAWSGAAFNHTQFPLTGAHQAADCTDCHQDGTFSVLPFDCASCHLTEYQATTNPNHVAGGFSTDCQACHNTVSWQGAQFNHNGITNNCDQCHLTDYSNTTNPNHAASGFPTTCEDCHNTASWLGGGFNHNGITNNCDQCHLSDYNGTTNPNHIASGFPTTCENCHNTTSWLGAGFNHNGITNNCDQCHLTDYNNTSNPNHIASGFPLTCETCHDTNAWAGAIFNHTFNIKSGPHKKFDCTECHQVPTNFNIASCTHCHEHRQSKMDKEHKGVSGYSWISSACISCHPTGKE